MKRPWTKAMAVIGVLALALLVLLGKPWRTLLAPAPANSAAPSPASAAKAAGKARRRATELQPGQPGSIAGRVAEPAGAPVAGALVCALPEPAFPGAPQPAAVEPVCAPSAEDGRYALSGLPPERWAITASAPRHRPARYAAPDASRAPFVELGAGEARTGVDLVLPAGGVEVRGQVEDIGGGAVSGALVTLEGFGPGLGGVVARSDAQGAYAAWVDEGRYMARAQADGYAEGFRDGVAPGPALKLQLTPASALVGRVVEAGTGTPVEGAKITLDSEGGWGMRRGAPVARSDAEGRFRVARLPPGRYRLVARALGKLGQARESVLLGLGQTSREVVIEVHRARVVAGRVEVAPDGAPCTRGTVGLLSPAQGGFEHAVIEGDGSVLFDAVLRGSYEVVVACADHAAEPTYPAVEVGDADVEDLVWTVRAGLSIRGRVVDRDQNPVRAAVHAYAPTSMGPRGPTGAAAQNEADGTFVLKGLSPEKYVVMARPIDHAEPAPVEVELRDEHAPEVTIVVDRGGAIEGIVTDEDRKPVGGVDVAILGIQGPPANARMGFMRPPAGGTARSLDDGSFVLRGLPPGDYRVSAGDAPRALPGPGPFGGEPEGVSARVEAGTSARVTLVVERRNGEIHGRVVDEIGEPVTDAFVHAERELGGAVPEGGVGNLGRARWGAFSRSPALTDPEGKFVVGGLPAGAYTVHAYRKGGGETFAEHVRTGDGVTLTLKPAGAISGALSVPSGKVPEQFTVRALDRASMLFRMETFAFTGGAFTISDLPEGKYELSTETQEGTASVEVALAPGEQRSGVVLALAPLASLKGQVVSLDGGAPIAGVRLNAFARKAMQTPSPPFRQEDTLTDEAGRFQLNQVPSGPVVLTCAPPDPMGSPYDVAVLPVDAQPGAVIDVGRVVMAKRRVGPGDLPGDLGFSIKDAFPLDLSARPLEVFEVRPGGPAAQAGLQVGDVIVSVDGHDVRGKMAYLYRPLSTVPAGTQVTLGLARGASVSITAGKMQLPSGALPAAIPAR
ncbi:carboxypeptidase regulatory-like domain-containing protein [Sorangium sp. So ce134]